MCNKMSDVRLSNASPTVERVDARLQDNVRPPTRRNLFGTPDRGETRRLFEASIQESVQSFMEEYDFDPVNERPLTPRSYDWQEENDAPEFFRRAPHRRQQPQSEAECLGENDRREAEERDGRQSGRNGSKKRRSGSSGPCNGESQSKRSHSDEEEDDDDDQASGAARQAVRVAEERPSRPVNGAEVQ
ncbi:LOW QUALITY PROTEIN: cyclin-dependent kinase inhibitor 1Ba [Xyrichtys novacula]|uniref:Cyclin-dependent kinase inhibitor 1B n=1 Tax=Xyrichtys novacula TaxID=13765 RepID=A0AAV1F2P3_XYRNO|nr:LOW QUALITY PROTEIN: cyclin-dependent kinase inhibitor 1Ba [Xyrichtys novacula]